MRLYFFWVAGAAYSWNSVVKAFIARSMLMRPGVASAVGGSGCSISAWPSHEAAFSHKATSALASSQSALPVCLRLNLPPSVPDTWIRQPHFFQPGIFGVCAFAFGAMAAIQFERHAILDAGCTPLHAV